MPAIGQIIDGRYRLERKAGAGGMGIVYRATDLQTQSPVAVKLLLPSANEISEQRFVREAEVLASLRAPEIVNYLAHGRMPDGSPWLAIEWLEGEALDERLKRGSLGPLETVKVGSKIATALAIAHRKEVVHRDIKPANVFLVDKSTDQVKTLDFGIARLRGERVQLTEAGALIGSPLWLSPEQARTEELDGRSDLFSLGSVLYACVSGASPFAGQQMPMVLISIARGEITPLERVAPAVPPRLGNLIGLLLRVDREERPADARWVVEELRAIEADLTERPSAPLSSATLTLLGLPLPPTPTMVAPEVPAPRSGPMSAPSAPAVLSPPRRQAGVRTLLVILVSFLLLAGTGTGVFFLVRSAQKPSASERSKPKPGGQRDEPAPAASESSPGRPPSVLDEIGLGDLAHIDAMVAFGRLEKYLLKRAPGVAVVQYTAMGLPGGNLDLSHPPEGNQEPTSLLSAFNASGTYLYLDGRSPMIQEVPSKSAFGPIPLPRCTFRQIYDDAVSHGFDRTQSFKLSLMQTPEGPVLALLTASGFGGDMVLVSGTCKTKKRLP